MDQARLLTIAEQAGLLTTHCFTNEIEIQKDHIIRLG